MVGTEVKRDAGAGGWLVASETTEGVWYEVRLAPESCTCKGFEYRGRCKHLGMVEAMFAETPVDLEEPEAMTWDSGDVDGEEEDPEEVPMDGNSNPHLAAVARGVLVRMVELGPEPMLGTLTPAIVAVASERDTNNRRQYDAKECTMSSLPDVDVAAEMADRRWEHLKSCVREDDVWTTFKSYLDLIANVKSNALAKLVDEFMELPPQDAYELQGIVQGMPLRQKIRLADTVLECLGQAWLSVAHDVENRPF
jgi:SWIM zinc finger